MPSLLHQSGVSPLTAVAIVLMTSSVSLLMPFRRVEVWGIMVWSGNVVARRPAVRCCDADADANAACMDVTGDTGDENGHGTGTIYGEVTGR